MCLCVCGLHQLPEASAPAPCTLPCRMLTASLLRLGDCPVSSPLGATRRGRQVGWGWEERVILCVPPGVGWTLQTAFQTPSPRGPRGRRPPGGRHSQRLPHSLRLRHLPGLPCLPQHLVPQGKLVLESAGVLLSV